MCCHIVTLLTRRSRSGREAAQQQLSGGELGDDVGGRSLAAQEADRLTGPDRSLVRALPRGAQLVVTTVPLLGERVAKRAAAVLRGPRDAAPDVEHRRVDRVGLARRKHGLASGWVVEYLRAGEKGGADDCARSARGEDGGEPARGRDAAGGQHRYVDSVEHCLQ